MSKTADQRISPDETKPVDSAELPILDPDCDPENPRKVAFSDISSAAFNLRNGIQITPCTVRIPILEIITLFQRSLQLSKLTKMDIYFKKEYLHVTGSFKERGARYALTRLTDEEKSKGVIAASAGNCLQ